MDQEICDGLSLALYATAVIRYFIMPILMCFLSHVRSHMKDIHVSCVSLRLEQSWFCLVGA